MLSRCCRSVLAGSLVALLACSQDTLQPSFDVVVTNATNGKIAFTSNRDGNSEIYVMDPDGSNPTRLTNAPAHDDFPAWSSDGTRIAFASTRSLGNRDIWVMNADGTNPMQLTTAAADDFMPTWSPDDNEIAFVSERSGSRQIWVMNADGTGQVNLSNNDHGNEQPHWSPDGTKIAFNRSGLGADGDNGGGEVYVMNAADGSGQTNLTNDPHHVDAPNDWSPDGTKILFSSNRDLNVFAPAELWVMNADGTGKTRLTNNTATTEQWSSWSPDGTQIAFLSDRDGNGEIYVMNADGTGQTNLTNSPTVETLPDWGVAVAPNPTEVSQCKNGGWEAYGFRNQGQCVRYVETGKDSRIGQ